MTKQETFKEFKDSFSYRSRTDLNFKFLAGLSEEDAALFFQDLLWKLGDSFIDGDLNRLREHVRQWQSRSYAGSGQWTYPDGPFTTLKKPLSESRLLLLTSSGHFVDGDDPEPFGVQEMTQDEAISKISEFLKTAPTLSKIPRSIPLEKLRVRHGGYPIRAAQADPDVALPIKRLSELQTEGLIGELHQDVFSFVGACAQMPLLKRTGPEWVAKFQGLGVDAALLVPV